MVAENPTWGAPRVHGELKMLRFDISERTVLRWMRKAPRSPEPAKRWAAFLGSHREATAAMDFFKVPTVTFGMLYCFFVISHDRRRILAFGVTKHPASAWVSQRARDLSLRRGPEISDLRPRFAGLAHFRPDLHGASSVRTASCSER
jgi:hypothetical protein